MSALSALPPPLITIRNETFFWVDVGWRCWQAVKACNGGWLRLPDAQRYYTTLQSWQVTGSADGVHPGYLVRFSPYLASYAGCGRDARDPRGMCNNLACTQKMPASRYRAIAFKSERDMSRIFAKRKVMINGNRYKPADGRRFTAKIEAIYCRKPSDSSAPCIVRTVFGVLPRTGFDSGRFTRF